MSVQTGIPDIIAGTSDATAEAAAAFNRVGVVFNKISDPAFWQRAGVIFLGIVLVYWGALLSISGTRVFKQGLSAGATVLSKGVI